MIDTILQRRNRFTWALLAFQGGYVNIGGLLTIHIFVSHVTGFSAHLSNEIMAKNYLKSLYFLLVPLFFLIGAFVSSLFTEIRRAKNLSPVYVHILLLLSFLFLAVALFGNFSFFGRFGEPFENFRDFMLLSILAFSCGAQNAIFTHYSGSIIRTTHLTGITTDLGIGFAKAFISKDRIESKINSVRIEIIISFVIGSLAGSFLFPQYEFLGFILPSIISAFIGIRLYTTKKMLESKTL